MWLVKADLCRAMAAVRGHNDRDIEARLSHPGSDNEYIPTGYR